MTDDGWEYVELSNSDIKDVPGVTTYDIIYFPRVLTTEERAMLASMALPNEHRGLWACVRRAWQWLIRKDE